jgi:alpha-L-fucosidase
MTALRINRWVVFIFFSTYLLYAQTTEQLQRAFAELRFGTFIHFGIMTFTGAAWATPNQDVSKFDPAKLDCGQWAEAFAAAKMKFGIITTKHHDGFCLWNSAYTENDVASIPWKEGQGDVVQEFVDALLAQDLIYPA